MSSAPSSPAYQRIAACRACASPRLVPVLALGPQPLANSFLRSPEEFAGEQSFPLDVAFCEGCSLLQILDAIDPEVLFRHYVYVTGTSETIARHNAAYARTAADLLRLGARDLVVEAASNDGSLLLEFRRLGIRTLGVEPATNIAAIARDRGIDTVNRFFGTPVVADLLRDYGPARAVIGNNVLAHVPDPGDFLLAASAILAEDGLVMVEVPYLGEFLDRLEYDTVYHEHLCYFSVSSLLGLFRQAGLSVVRVDHVPVHGGSIRVYAARTERVGDHAEAVRAEAAREAAAGFTTPQRYHRFAADVAENRRQLLELLRGLQAEGKTLAAYGAPAKGNTLLNYCGIGTDLLPFTVDKNPLKVGSFTPGMHLPVRPVETLLEQQPDYTLILPWNFAEEIMAQQQAYRDRGGRFILPLPVPRVVA